MFAYFINLPELAIVDSIKESDLLVTFSSTIKTKTMCKKPYLERIDGVVNWYVEELFDCSFSNYAISTKMIVRVLMIELYAFKHIKGSNCYILNIKMVYITKFFCKIFLIITILPLLCWFKQMKLDFEWERVIYAFGG